ncbi:hypothetical protein DN752_24065 [Echinicola strongylocentroti]|uniref:ROK family protein n=1 Tax=Echinicola strongylocentroti TaxID=1795355 RepID=A0A2Z4IQ98_9BACT|nr:class I mannose-6-phosphate isomerase [Echinicola strongylocentroti]AWW32950.1 hypothetical protein DN752_24065 [Echinicola strongylocentroti]
MNRLSNQPQVPVQETDRPSHSYTLFPSFDLGSSRIGQGYESLFDQINAGQVLIMDGYVGVDWQEISTALKQYLTNQNLAFELINMADFYKPTNEILEMIAPDLGGDDPVFGKKTQRCMADYIDGEKLDTLTPASDQITVIYGSGAAQVGIKGTLVYFDLPKNELQYRMRAGSVHNLGCSGLQKNNKQMYKHFFFVDWEICNREKKALFAKVDYIVDQQRPDQPTWMSGDDFRQGLDAMSTSYFRVRPWFEPGVWGGQWLREHIPELPQNEPNYAWSFEMIVPENGVIFSSDGILLELSFDWLMYKAGKNVLGKAHDRFGDDFPIRFDFLDTFDGGNLSLQCHPTDKYAKAHFGEKFTQDETYYIMDNRPGANVYLGFQEDIEPELFRKELEKSIHEKSELEVEQFVQKLPSEKHGLYLIPNGTVHCSGVDNLVLEISATPYIYTFKMYDWQRLDLNGEPRPLNVERAFDNLDFERKGEEVQRTLISHPEVIESGSDWQLVELPTHEQHFYKIVRYEFDTEISVPTHGQCHLLMLVEGESISLSTENGRQATFHYAETFAVPAAANSYKLKNHGSSRAMVVISYVKESAC